MKEYENGFTTKAMLDENNGKKSPYRFYIFTFCLYTLDNIYRLVYNT